jgi:hypothetical protein
VFSNSANDFRIVYCPLRMSRIRIGSFSCAALQIAWTEYWKDPSPMTATTGLLRRVSRSASAIPTDAGRFQPSPPLAKV